MMDCLISKRFCLQLIILVLIIFWQFFILHLIFPVHYIERNIFFSDLINQPIHISLWLGYLFGFVDMVFFYVIGRKLFASNNAFIPALIFGISPWTAYLLAAGSVYPFIVCLILLIGYGFLLLGSSKQIFGKTLIIIGLVTASYSSLYIIIVLPLFFIGLVLFKITPLSKLAPIMLSILILILPLAFFIILNFGGAKNIFNQQVTIFDDPGVIQSINVFQGQSQKSGMELISKIAENKYAHLLRYFVLKTSGNLAPATYFTPQEKLLGFSFSPPIYLGLIIPFLYGLYQILCSNNLRKYFFLSLILIIPSVISQQQVDLNRLFIIIPTIVLTISYGLVVLYHKRGQKLFGIILCLVLSLIIFQMVVTVFDISALEHQRYLKYYSITKVEIGRQ